RVDEMMTKGFLKEAVSLYPFRHINALNTLGYKELFDFIENKTSLEKAIELIKQHTRNYAKRQITWFKHDEDCTAFHPNEIEKIKAFVEVIRQHS
ncbi:MAG: tRNA (adenosine(37)-N6)-dimethylallyltransferase MiaA, partial [Bacteroidia bacterium]